MSASPAYASTPLNFGATLTAADTSRTAPAAYQDVIPTGKAPAGMQVERVVVVPVATTVASVLRIWCYDGVAWHLLFEAAIPALTVAAGQAVIAQTFQAVDFPGLFPILIPAGGSLRATINDAQTGIHVSAQGGGF